MFVTGGDGPRAGFTDRSTDERVAPGVWER